MEQKVCLDTDFIIAVLNGEEKASEILDKIKDLNVCTTTINLFELLLRETNLNEIEIFRDKVRLLDLDEIASRKASAIFKNLKERGKIIEFRDIFISSICIANNCRLLTFNKKHFENIKELKLI